MYKVGSVQPACRGQKVSIFGGSNRDWSAQLWNLVDMTLSPDYTYGKQNSTYFYHNFDLELMELHSPEED